MTRSGFGTATVTRSNPASWLPRAFLKRPNAHISKISCRPTARRFTLWQVDRDEFPYGIPQLMMGFTQDGQLDESLVEARDRRFGVSWKQRRKRRADIPTPSSIPGANSW